MQFTTAHGDIHDTGGKPFMVLWDDEGKRLYLIRLELVGTDYRIKPDLANNHIKLVDHGYTTIDEVHTALKAEARQTKMRCQRLRHASQTSLYVIAVGVRFPERILIRHN